jgi:metal-dependent amidase/aminoacylase/carboxypeptidase family protein
VENDLAQMRQQLRNLVKKGMDLNAASINHVLILDALQNEENLLSMDTTTDSVEIEKQKKEIRAKIQENIAELLEGKRSQNACKVELKCVLKKIADLMSQMEVVEEFKESIRHWWVRSVEDGNRL